MSLYGDVLYGDALYAGGGGTSEGGWVIIGGAVVDTVAEGPAYYTDEDGNPVEAPGVFVQPFSAAVYDPDDLSVVLSTLDETFSRSFHDEVNDPGSGTFAFENTDTDSLTNVDMGNWVNMYVYGNLAFTMIVEAMHRVTYDQGEEHDQITVVSGRGHVAEWEDAVMYPSRGVDSLPIEDDRVFNWTSLIYDHSGWAYAKQIAGFLTWTPAWGGGFPAEFPDQTAYWIWASSGTAQWAAPGPCYFRKHFNVPAGITAIAIYYACDDRCKIYVDGIPFADQPGNGEYANTKYVVVDVTQGQHLIAVEAFNDPLPFPVSYTPSSPVTYTVVSGDTLWAIARRFYGDGQKWRIIYDANQAQIQADATTAGLWDPDDPGHWIFPGQVFNMPGLRSVDSPANPGGLIIAIYEHTAAGPADLLTHTDASWRIVAYPSDPPGMTVGRVLRLARKEAFNRACTWINGWQLMFSDTVDSAGNAWPVVADIATKVGTNYLTFLQELSVTYIDFWAAPGTKRLYAWNKGTRGKTRAVDLHGPTDPDDPLSGNLYNLAHTVIS